MKKALSLLLCLFVILSVFTCCKKEELPDDETETTVLTEEDEKEFTVSLGYYSHESLNPFSTESRTNKNISTLLYDSLFKTESDYEAVGEIAESFDFEGGDLIVNLKTDIIFTDGSTLTAEDVVYSFNQAKSAPLYKASLKNFSSARAQTENAVLFTLYTPDTFAVNALQFPVVKYASLAYGTPVGSGRYILKEKGDKSYLTRNENYSLDEVLEQKKINLFDLNKTENPFYLLQIGELSFVYDDLSSDSLSYKINASTAEINLNNLVFLAFNKNSETLTDKNIKNSICLSVDKALLCGEIYDSLAVPADTPFNPSWYVLNGFTHEEKDTAETPLTLLDKSGYIYEYDINEYRSKDFEYLKLTFLVSDGDEKKVSLAKSITNTLKKNGIDVTLNIIEKDKFTSALSEGDYDMYLGEVKLTEDMSLSSFFTEGQSLSYGIDASSSAATAYYDFKEGKIDITTFVKVFEENMPFLPICYKKGVAYYSRELKYEGTVSENDIFSNIYSWGK